MAPQSLLDPSDKTVTGRWIEPDGVIPSRVRKLGLFPSTDLWQPGDLLLFGSKHPSLPSKACIRAQSRAGYADDHARWHHAAVYIGRNAVCEARALGVQWRLIYPYIGGHLIRVRRGVSVPPDKGWEIAVEALKMRGTLYNYFELVRLGLRSFSGWWRPKQVSFIRPKAVICSMLFAGSYTKIVKTYLGPEGGEATTPAFLSYTDHLRDVPSCWRTIAEP
jgi:hypothetical protein